MENSTSIAGLGWMAFPPELILEVKSYLSIVAQICLDLSCRTFYYKYFRQDVACRLRTPSGKRILKFLCRLEKDNPDLYLCEGCFMLHYRANLSTTTASWQQTESQKQCQHKLASVLTFSNRLYIPYHIPRLVMNRHLRGEAHGLPLSALEFSSEASGNHGAIYSQDVSARIVQDQLLLQTNTIVLNGPCQGFWVNPPIQICQHRTTSTDRLTPLDADGIDDDQRNSAISCRSCMTDYNIRCSREADGDYLIQITVYQKILGVRREHRMFEH